MKIERVFIYCLLAETSPLASCSGKEMTDGNGTNLPKGKYSVQLAGVQIVDEPQTCVSENTDGKSSKWDSGEVIYVKPDNTNEAGEFRVTDTNDSVTLEGVNINASKAIKIESGTPTIILQGENTLPSTDGAGSEVSNNSNVIIDGKNTGKFIVTCAGKGAADIQSRGSNCDIKIMDATIIATGSTNTKSGYNGGAGIGGGPDASLDNIEIINSTVTATGKAGAAAIELGNCWTLGTTYTMGTVSITNSRITANVEKDGENVYGACIGLDAIDGGISKAKCGSIIISSNESWDTFISQPNADEGGYKIGQSSNVNTSSKSEWGGVTFNGVTKAGSKTKGIQ